METLTEPHTLTATLSCMIGMARCLVSPNNRYPEGRAHVLPLLMGCLPGVDPNDFSKCMVALQKVYNFATSNIFETCVSGRMVADVCRAAAKDWGRAGDVAALGVCWHVPSAEEENFVFQLLSRLLHPELERIKGHVSGDQPMSRVPSMVNLGGIRLHIGVDYDDSRENYRESICQTMRLLLHHILEHSEDDTKSLFVIIKVSLCCFLKLLFMCENVIIRPYGTHKKEFDSRWKSFTLVKKSMENKMRKLVVEGSEYKVVHQELLCDLLLLSTSTYSQVQLTKHTLIRSFI
ncbi:hypothetical protein F2P81_022474 [Scophthalmus maximus]|uniref:Proteasome activator Blm10 middle HEAT repeats region domain-containing protein n=1 Tax=Scophthalmus maximus TaxID=52904 RepID=A0A6A4RUC8_SCOMX|nr:hypothetical protein F2P81_022474 [Scophthalmus maximus]